MSENDDCPDDGTHPTEVSPPELDRTLPLAAPSGGRSSARSTGASFHERYRRRELLGAGGMGEVQLVEDRRIGRDVALKRMLSSEAAADPGARDRFQREVALQGRLEHPSVVPVYDSGIGPDGAPYFTMKRISGRTLGEVITRLQEHDEETLEAFPQRRLIGIVSQVAATVDYAHSRGVLHRDLKPSNIMIGEFGEVYVLDWGIAGAGRLAGDLAPDAEGRGSDPTLAGGSFGYASPEQMFRESAPLGPETDVWSLGALLFEVLTGRRLRAPRGAPVPDQRRPSERRPDLEIPPELDLICAQALAPTPEGRYRRVHEFHAELERYLNGERDAELRRRLASEHAHRAGRAAMQAIARPGEESLAARRDALKEIGRALGLEPGHPGALKIFADLIATPPSFVPAEVRTALELSNRENRRRAMTYAALSSMLGLVATVLFFLWTGVRSAVPAVAVVIVTALALAVAFVGSRPGRGGRPELFAFVVLSVINFGFYGRIGGPLVFVPVLYTGLAVTMAGLENTRDRAVLLGITILGFLVPIVLEAVGVLPSSYLFADDRMTILPQAIPLRAVPSIVGLVFVTLYALGPVAVMARTRDRLTQKEEAQSVLNWQLARMVEPEQGVEFGSSTRLNSTLW